MKNILIVASLLVITSCAPIRVNYDYEKTTDFSKYKSYNYYSNIDSGLSELDTKRLLDALDANLQAKGIQLAKKPDFFIDIKSSEYRENQSSSVGVGMGGTGRNVGGGVSIGIPIGQANVNRQIQFDFVDENGNGLFWQAVSESGYNPNSLPEKKAERLNKIVAKVLSKFPPNK